MAKLTDDEIDLLQEQYDCYGDCDAPRIHDLARAIEAAVLAKAARPNALELYSAWMGIRKPTASPSAVVEAPAEPPELDLPNYGSLILERGELRSALDAAGRDATRLREALAGALDLIHGRAFGKNAKNATIAKRWDEWEKRVEVLLAESATTGKEPIHG